MIVSLAGVWRHAPAMRAILHGMKGSNMANPHLAHAWYELTRAVESDTNQPPLVRALALKVLHYAQAANRVHAGLDDEQSLRSWDLDTRLYE